MTTAKISPQAARVLERLQRRFHKPKTVLIDLALKKYEDQLLLEEINEGYARLKADKTAWEEELKERQELNKLVPMIDFYSDGAKFLLTNTRSWSKDRTKVKPFCSRKGMNRESP